MIWQKFRISRLQLRCLWCCQSCYFSSLNIFLNCYLVKQKVWNPWGNLFFGNEYYYCTGDTETRRPVWISNRGLGYTIVTVPSGEKSEESRQVIISEVFGLPDKFWAACKNIFFLVFSELISPTLWTLSVNWMVMFGSFSVRMSFSMNQRVVIFEKKGGLRLSDS